MHLKKCEFLLKLAGLKGTPTLKASEYVMKAIIKPCNLPQTGSTFNEKYESYRYLYS